MERNLRVESCRTERDENVLVLRTSERPGVVTSSYDPHRRELIELAEYLRHLERRIAELEADND